MVALLAPTTADSQFIGGDAEVDKSLHSMSKSNNDSFNHEAVLLRAYAQDEQFVAIFPNCLQARLHHLFGCITPGLRILFHLAPRQTRIKACVALASAILFRNRHRARDPYRLSPYRGQGTALSNLNRKP